MSRERVERAAWLLGLLGVVGSVIGWAIFPAAFGDAWLAAFTLWLAWPVGSMALLLIHALTGGRWGILIRPQLVMGLATAPLALLAVIPLLFLIYQVYPWTQHNIAQQLGNTRYLNPVFFYGRVAGCVVFWGLLGAALLLALRREQPQPLLWRLAPPLLILLLFSVTVGAVDMTLSLDPHFNSTAYGMIIAAEWALFALAVAILPTAFFALGDSSGLESLGKLLLGLVILWGYLVFVQFLIVWNSDLAADAPWYARRSEGGWGIVAYIVFVLHFFVPLLLLLWPQMQRSRSALMAISLMIIAAEIPRAWWLVLPSAGRGVGWIDGLTMLAVLGLSVGLWLRLPGLILRIAPNEVGHA